MDHTQVFELPGSIPGEPNSMIPPVTPLKIRKISLPNPKGLSIVPTTPITTTSPLQIPLRSPSRPSMTLTRPDAHWSASKPLPSLPVIAVRARSNSRSSPSVGVKRPVAQDPSPTDSHASNLSAASTVEASTISTQISDSTIHPGSSASHTPPKSAISRNPEFQSGSARRQMTVQMEKPTPGQKIKDGAFFAFVLLPLSCWYTQGEKRLGPQGDLEEGVDDPARRQKGTTSRNDSPPRLPQARSDRGGGKSDDLSSGRGSSSRGFSQGVRPSEDLSSSIESNSRGTNSRSTISGPRQSENLGGLRIPESRSMNRRGRQ